MKSNFKPAVIGFGVGLVVAAAGAQAAVQATQHEHSMPSAQMPAANAMNRMEGMKDMDAMMADPATRQKMIANMGQCRDMMSMMMEHMQHQGEMGDHAPTPPKQ
jgi:hypothetical protein